MTTALDDAITFLISDPGRNAGLPVDDHALAILGCRLALPLDLESLADQLRRSMDDGVPDALLQAAFLHAIGYLGVVRMAPAIRLFESELMARGFDTNGEAKFSATHEERVATGTELYDRFDPGRAAEQGKLYEVLTPRYYAMAMEFAGVTLGDPAISARQRQVMTVAMLSCLGGQSAQLTFHAGVALDRGVTVEQLGTVLILVQAHAGLPRANAAAQLVREVVLARRR